MFKDILQNEAVLVWRSETFQTRQDIHYFTKQRIFRKYFNNYFGRRFTVVLSHIDNYIQMFHLRVRCGTLIACWRLAAPAVA